MWGLVVGVAQAATPLAFWWLDTATGYALGLAVIASVYIGFAVADGRRTVLAVETGVASMFVIIAAAAVTGTPWLLVVGLAGHGLKDLWQHRRQFVANTRWWPPFCLVFDWRSRQSSRSRSSPAFNFTTRAWSGVPAQPRWWAPAMIARITTTQRPLLGLRSGWLSWPAAWEHSSSRSGDYTGRWSR
jgi:hypothetical protein